MTLDHDLLNRWLGAVFATESDVRELIEELQDARNELAALEAADQEARSAEEERLAKELEETHDALDIARSDKNDAEACLTALRDEARAAMARLSDALGESCQPGPIVAPNVVPLRP